MTEPIRLNDRLHAVLARDPRLTEVLLAASPSFAILRNPLTLKTMGRLATVEYAARVAGVDAKELLRRLNAVLGGAPVDAAPVPAPSAPRGPDELPEEVRTRAEVACDVRDALRAGHEPLRFILDAAREVGDDEVLHLRAIFEPAPLYAVLGRQRFRHFTRKEGDDDWHVWFWREAGAAPPEAAPAARPEEPPDDALVVLDVRGLEPPEPMMRTLEALERLPRGKTLLQLNVRVPQFLIPQLTERGFAYEVREQSPDLVRIFIHHAT